MDGFHLEAASVIVGRLVVWSKIYYGMFKANLAFMPVFSRIWSVVTWFTSTFISEFWPVWANGIFVNMGGFFWIERGWFLIWETYLHVVRLILILLILLNHKFSTFISLIIFALKTLVMIHHNCLFDVLLEIFVNYLENLKFIVILNSRIITNYWNTLPIICCTFNWAWIIFNFFCVLGSLILRDDAREGARPAAN